MGGAPSSTSPGSPSPQKEEIVHAREWFFSVSTLQQESQVESTSVTLGIERATGRKSRRGDFPGGPVVENLPSSAGDEDSVSGQGTKTKHTLDQLSPRAPAAEPVCYNQRYHVTQRGSLVLQLAPGAAKY